MFDGASSRSDHGLRFVVSERVVVTTEGDPGRTPPNHQAPIGAGGPGTHRSTGVSSHVPGEPVHTRQRRRAEIGRLLPRPNPSANSVGGWSGRNGVPPP